MYNQFDQVAGLFEPVKNFPRSKLPLVINIGRLKLRMVGTMIIILYTIKFDYIFNKKQNINKE